MDDNFSLFGERIPVDPPLGALNFRVSAWRAPLITSPINLLRTKRQNNARKLRNLNDKHELEPRALLDIINARASVRYYEPNYFNYFNSSTELPGFSELQPGQFARERYNFDYLEKEMSFKCLKKKKKKKKKKT